MIKAEKIEFVDINSIKPMKNNRNIHPKSQIDQLIKIIEYQGNRVPIIVDANTMEIVSGHGRHRALKQMGVQEIPVIFQTFDSEEQKYAFMVSDNAIASQAVLDLSNIHKDLPEMAAFNIDLLGIKDFQFEPIGEIKPEENLFMIECPHCKMGFESKQAKKKKI